MNVGDDAHFGHPAWGLKGLVEVYAERLDRGLAGRTQGRSLYYPTRGSALRELLVEGERLYVQTCVPYAIALTGGDRG